MTGQHVQDLVVKVIQRKHRTLTIRLNTDLEALGIDVKRRLTYLEAIEKQLPENCRVKSSVTAGAVAACKTPAKVAALLLPNLE
jgi:hypothetical protein